MKFGKINRNEAVYLMCYSMMIATAYLFQFMVYKPRVTWVLGAGITAIIFASIIRSKRESIKKMAFRCAIILVYTVAGIVNNNPKMLMYAALLCGADLTSFKRLSLVSFITMIIMIIIVPIISKLGIYASREFFRSNGVKAYTFGFNYYNVVPYTFYFLVFEYLYLKSSRAKKATMFELGVILLINYVIYKFSTLRLTYYLNYLTVAMYIVFIKMEWFNFANYCLKILTMLLFPGLFLVSLWINSSFSFSNPTHVLLNKLLTDRLYLGNKALSIYPINLFGHYIETNNGISGEYFYIDCGYLYSLLGYGIIFTVVTLLLYMLICRYAAERNEKVLVIWLIGIAIFSFVNNQWIALETNPLLLCYPIIAKKYGTKENFIIALTGRYRF